MFKRICITLAIIQLVGCLAVIVSDIVPRFGADYYGPALFLPRHFLLWPGNFFSGLLLSTFHLHLPFIYLEAAVGMNVIVFVTCIAAWHAIREHISGIRPHRYAIAFIATSIMFITTNILYDRMKPVTCSDCFFPHGVPFHWYNEGGFLHDEAIMWGGLAADILIVVATATLFGSAWQWCSGRRAGSAS